MTDDPTTISRRTVSEWTLRSRHPYGNPFTDVRVDATFVGPSEQRFTIPAFYDGEQTWRVRFSPNEAGRWRYRTCSNPADADLADAAAYPAWMTRGLKLARASCPDASVHVEVFSPFTHFMELFGYEQALMHVLDEPDRCRAILAAYALGAADLGARQARCGVDAVLISSAFAGGGFISACS